MNILLTGAYQYTDVQLDKLSSLGKITFIKDERVPLTLNMSKFHIVVCNSLFLYNDIEKFTNLKFIQLTSAGLDRIPLDYIKKHNIVVASAKGVYSIPIAEWVILKILEIYKKSTFFFEAQNEKQWSKNRDILELTGKTAMVVGFGSIGSEIAKRLKAFDVNVIGVGRKKVKSEFIDETYLIDDLEYALEKSDITILTLPLTRQTHHLFNRDKLSKMKKNSVLINVSRGSIIDEIALVESLENDKFLGVALDVFEQEPLPKNNQLWDSKKVIITPHNSFVSDRVNERLFNTIYRGLDQQIKALNLELRGHSNESIDNITEK
ncbi:NAD(P)-dependent oxidoreductase [Priestia megaterium]|uniref:NAD(P)-dependent oxidoreductase n=1 Tax=Priestia megaterium TaxID=1404 RepID=UPI002D80AE38|nr:NAD(P)-dependent oxidoreductase [Priestia megaterium]MEB4860645.1 NAD(P)-dependent oxidoreductase [Priestia megaterium]